MYICVYSFSHFPLSLSPSLSLSPPSFSLSPPLLSIGAVELKKFFQQVSHRGNMHRIRPIMQVPPLYTLVTPNNKPCPPRNLTPPSRGS